MVYCQEIYTLGRALSTILLQNTASNLVVHLTKNDGTNATGVLFSAVTAQIKRATDVAFASFTVTSGNWTEVGSGFYSITLTSSNTSIVGNLYLTVVTATTAAALLDAYVSAAVSPPTPPSPTAPTTVAISGFVTDIAGQPVKNAGVSFRVLGSPVSITGSGYATTPIVGKTDATGYFSVSLIQGLSVDVTIPAVNYRRTFIVPNADANLFNIV